MLTLIIISSIGITASYSIRIIFSSNKNSIKYKSDSHNHSSIYYIIPIITINPFAISLGAIIT
jgi:hypothetical protein